jgi:hypothetical protein
MDVLTFTDGIVVAWGDLNNDYQYEIVTQYRLDVLLISILFYSTDSFVYSPGNQTLAAHLFDDETFTYGRFGNMTLYNIASVASVHMADFNVDGHVDILVVSTSDDAAPLLQIDIYLQNTDALGL